MGRDLAALDGDAQDAVGGDGVQAAVVRTNAVVGLLSTIVRVPSGANSDRPASHAASQPPSTICQSKQNALAALGAPAGILIVAASGSAKTAPPSLMRRYSQGESRAHRHSGADLPVGGGSTFQSASAVRPSTPHSLPRALDASAATRRSARIATARGG